MPRTQGTYVLVLLPFCVLACFGCGGGGQEGTPADSDLIVTGFSHLDRTDLYRDQVIEIRFSAPVEWRSVDYRTIRVLTGPNQQTPVEGALIVDGNRVLFDPTYSRRVLPNVAPGTADRPFGFEPQANYIVHVPAGGPKTVTNLAGDGILLEFVGAFRTGEDYTPELRPPEFLSMTFDPAPTEAGVAYDARVILGFDEPIAPESMQPGGTVRIVNEDVPDFEGKPVEVPGTFQASPDGTEYTFIPSFHYGIGPYHIAVILTDGVTDRAGNPLANPQTLRFVTERHEGVNTIAVLRETFDTNAYEDVIASTADWNGGTPGELRGGAITTTTVVVDYVPDTVNSMIANFDAPLVARTTRPACAARPNGVHMQMSFTQADIGGEGAITDVAWGPDSNALYAANHPNVQIRLGHTNTAAAVLGPVFDSNFDDGPPLPHYSGRYDIPQRANINAPSTELSFWPFPKLTSPFDYDGQRGLVLDFRCDPADNCQTLRGWFWGVGGPLSPGSRMVLASTKNGTADDTSGGVPWVFDMQFTKKRRITRAQSLWYDTARQSPIYAEPILTPSVQSGGATLLLELKGADGMVDTNGKVVPDPSTETPWSPTVNAVDGKRFVKFRFVFYANLNSGTVPRLTTVEIPYEF